MDIKCGKCEKVWDYKGKKLEGWDPNKYPIYVCCPRCHKSICIKEIIKKEEQ